MKDSGVHVIFKFRFPVIICPQTMLPVPQITGTPKTGTVILDPPAWELDARVWIVECIP